MANSKKHLKQAGEVAGRQIHDFSARAEEVASNVAERSREALQEIRKRLPENSERYLPLIAGGVAVFLLGYGLAKRRSSIRGRLEGVQAKVRDSVEGFDYSPFLQLGKLWLLTRIAR